MGKLCIEVTKESKVASISESLCNGSLDYILSQLGCGICVRKCPFNAIKIINLPKELNKDTVHRYHANSFKLHRLLAPKHGNVVGLVGANGTGKVKFSVFANWHSLLLLKLSLATFNPTLGISTSLLAGSK